MLSSANRKSYFDILQLPAAACSTQFTVVSPLAPLTPLTPVLVVDGRLGRLLEGDARLPLTVRLGGGDLTLLSLLTSRLL